MKEVKKKTPTDWRRTLNEELFRSKEVEIIIILSRDTMRYEIWDGCTFCCIGGVRDLSLVRNYYDNLNIILRILCNGQYYLFSIFFLLFFCLFPNQIITHESLLCCRQNATLLNQSKRASLVPVKHLNVVNGTQTFFLSRAFYFVERTYTIHVMYWNYRSNYLVRDYVVFLIQIQIDNLNVHKRSIKMHRTSNVIYSNK